MENGIKIEIEIKINIKIKLKKIYKIVLKFNLKNLRN